MYLNVSLNIFLSKEMYWAGCVRERNGLGGLCEIGNGLGGLCEINRGEYNKIYGWGMLRKICIIICNTCIF